MTSHEREPDEETRETSEKSPILPRSEVSRKATAGVFFITSAGALLLVVGFVGSLILARLLTPSDFGILALGGIAITLGMTLADGGLAAAMIRREIPPTHAEFRSLVGLQLAITTVIAAVSIAIALNFGETGRVASVMILTLPLASFQTAARVMIIRDLEFWRTSVTDAAATLSFYAWSITAAALGAGVWSMVTGTVVRALVATALIVALSPVGMVWPGVPSVRRLYPEIRFGVRFQLVGILVAVRDQLLNLLTALLAGVTTVGAWAFTGRLMQAPGLLFQSMWQVGFPAMAHLLAGKHDPKPILEDGVRLTTVGAALVLAPFATATPILITPVFGEEWHTVGYVLPIECLSMLVVGPISVAAFGYLNASNQPATLVRAMSYGGAIALIVAAALLPLLGIVGLGLAFFASSALECILFDRYVNRSCGANLLRHSLVPIAVGTTASLLAIAFSRTLDDTIPAAIATGAVAFALTLSGFAAFCRDDLRATLRLVRKAMRTALSRRKEGPGGDVPEPLPETTPGLLLDP